MNGDLFRMASPPNGSHERELAPLEGPAVGPECESAPAPGDRHRTQAPGPARAESPPGVGAQPHAPPAATSPYAPPNATLPAAALLIDFENVLFGLGNRFGGQRAAEFVALPELLSVVRAHLWPCVRRAYGDWRLRELSPWQGEFLRQGFEAVPVLCKQGGSTRKNASDIRLAVDAVELALTSPHLSTFVIVSGDRDMVEIVRCLQRHGKRVWCIAPESSASSDLTCMSDLFLPYARLAEIARGTAEWPGPTHPAPPRHRFAPQPPATGAAGNGAPGAAPWSGPSHPSAAHGPASSLPAAQQELLAQTDLMREGFEPDAALRRERLERWYRFASAREPFTLVQVFDALAEGLAQNRSSLAKLFTLLYQGRAFELSNYDPSVPFRERPLRFSPEVQSAKDLIRLHERSALARLRSAGESLATAPNAVVLLGLAAEDLPYAEALLEELRVQQGGESQTAAAIAPSERGTIVGIQAGQRRKGVVKKVAEYGAVVSVDGIDGLLHVSDMSWGRVDHPGQLLKPNQEIEVLVLDVEPTRGRVNLGLKQLTTSPWNGIEERYPLGSEHEGIVVALKHYGAFVDLEQGVTGLVHNTEISWARHVHHPNELLEVGQRVRVVVQEVDREKRRMGLSIRASQSNPWELAELSYPVGSVVEGKVTFLAGYGAFVELETGLQGLLHISELFWTRQPDHPSEVLTVGETVRCRVLSVDARAGRMALGRKQLESDPWEQGLAEQYQPGRELDAAVVRIDRMGPVVLLEGQVEARLEGAPRLVTGDRVFVRILASNADERRIDAGFLHADFPENAERHGRIREELEQLRSALLVLLEERHPEPWLGSKLREELARRHGTRFSEASLGAPSFAGLLEWMSDVARVERRDGSDILVHRS